MAENEEKLAASYEDHARVEDWLGTVKQILKDLSYEFDGYEEDHTKGPGLYMAIVADTTLEDTTTSMETNPWWDIDEERYLDDDYETLKAELEEVAYEYDGGIPVWMDGKLHDYMVRFEPVPSDMREDLNYDSDMGTRHMSALETSMRDNIIRTLTLSEEDGRVNVFRNGEKRDGECYTRDDIVEEREA